MRRTELPQVGDNIEIFLHIGAHRTGTSTLQMSVGKNRQVLQNLGVAYWGPSVIRNGLFLGMFREPRSSDSDEITNTANESKTNIVSKIEGLVQRGHSNLLLSEENIMGSMKSNLRQAELYPNLFMRMAHFSSLFGGSCTRVGLSIRQYDKYWASSIAFAIKNQFHIPSPDELARISYQERTWREVIVEISEIFYNAKILVWDFDDFVGRNEEIVRILTGKKMSDNYSALDQNKHNASPSTTELRNILLERGSDEEAHKIIADDSVFSPFNFRQIGHMKSRYREDLDWLINGADGAAKFVDSETDFNFE